MSATALGSSSLRGEQWILVYPCLCGVDPGPHRAGARDVLTPVLTVLKRERRGSNPVSVGRGSGESPLLPVFRTSPRKFRGGAGGRERVHWAPPARGRAGGRVRRYRRRRPRRRRRRRLHAFPSPSPPTYGRARGPPSRAGTLRGPHVAPAPRARPERR